MQTNEHKYMWNHAGTALLISIWSDSSVQKQLRATLRNQPIWDDVARYMMKKGFQVNGKQCRTRIKNILVRYREIKRIGNFNGSGIEPFYNEVDRVMTARNSLAAAETCRSSSVADPLGMAERKNNFEHASQYINEEMVQVNIKSEQNLPSEMSEDSVEELQDSQDSSNQQFFRVSDDKYEDDQLTNTSAHMISISRRSPVPQQSDGATAVHEGKLELMQEHGHSSLHQASPPSQSQTRSGERASQSHTRSGERVANQFSRRSTIRMERLVMRVLRAQSEAVNKVLNAQSELFTKMMETDRERQARMETKLDCILQRLDNFVPSTISGSSVVRKSSDKDNDQESRLNRLLDRLDWTLAPSLIPAPSSRQLEISNKNQESKLDSLLDKLDTLIPTLIPKSVTLQRK